MSSKYANAMRQKFPRLWRALRLVKYPRQLFGLSESVFTRIHSDNFWEDSESRSGPGSTLSRTEVLRAALPQVFERLGIRSMLDIPCGDFNWMAHVALPLETYVGGDIVKSVVESNARKFGTETRRFLHLDLLRDNLPQCDAVFCRDCLVHFSDSDIRKALINISRSSATFLIATTYPGEGASMNIITGEWQPLDLQAPPFFLPEPIAVISEKEQQRDGSVSKKSLGVWTMEQLRTSLGRSKPS